jgi:hypothetical protein
VRRLAQGWRRRQKEISRIRTVPRMLLNHQRPARFRELS